MFFPLVEYVADTIKQVYAVLGEANVRLSKPELEALVREYHYMPNSVIDHLMNSYGSGGAENVDDGDDGMFGLELGNAPVKPPPGFKGPPANAPITKGPNSSAMAQHFVQHPAEKGTNAATVPARLGAALKVNALSWASAATETLPPDVVPFDFSEPSPDDLVLDKQKQAFQKGGPAAVSPAKTGPLFTSGGGTKGGKDIKVSGGPAKVAKAAKGAVPGLSVFLSCD